MTALQGLVCIPCSTSAVWKSGLESLSDGSVLLGSGVGSTKMGTVLGESGMGDGTGEGAGTRCGVRLG